jgi:hypothetical protein
VALLGASADAFGVKFHQLGTTSLGLVDESFWLHASRPSNDGHIEAGHGFFSHRSFLPSSIQNGKPVVDMMNYILSAAGKL